tara:strand:+ start:11147 stop:12649 length:1503 start_codon:yes stop_codon:yes gene_type:complete
MSEEKEVKEIEFELKGDGKTKGQVEAVFSVFNDIDSDGDVVLPKAIKSGFKSGSVPMVWSHKWDMPIGKGSIKQDKSKATFVGEFFMDTESGKEAYNLVKNMGDLQQWSFGFKVNDSEYGKFKKDGSDDDLDVRYLKDLSVYEVSPVLVGANQDTFTMAIKSDKETEAKIVESITVSHGEEKGVLTSDSFQKEEPVDDHDTEFEEEKAAPKDDRFESPAQAEERAKQLGCQGFHMHESNGEKYYMPCLTHEDYESRMKKYDSSIEYLNTIANGMKEVLKSIPTDDVSIEALKEITEKITDLTSVKDSEVSEKPASVQGKRFSDEVKDVLAALNNLVARVQSIGELRKKNGRKLGASATEALRAVQESVSDAFDELDKFVDEFGSEGTLETDVQVVEEAVEEVVEAEAEAEETLETEVEEAVAENPVEETQGSTVEATTESEEVEEVEDDQALAETTEEEASEITETEVDSELDSLWLESQQTLTEAILTDIEIQEENENI